jgi:hypothetical protein
MIAGKAGLGKDKRLKVQRTFQVRCTWASLGGLHLGAAQQLQRMKAEELYSPDLYGIRASR